MTPELQEQLKNLSQEDKIDELLPALHTFEMIRSRREYKENNRQLYALKEITED